ncbi:phage major capsid protein [Sinomonas sp. P10A9]|uniref:Phage major capsid protein n=1 Tax=Sinomonas puerhi TaxID=3238584 RepID=A0AB39KYQ9_9MICC
MSVSSDPMLSRLWARRDELMARRTAITDAVEARGDEYLTDAEDAEHRRVSDELGEVIGRIRELTDVPASRPTAGAAVLRGAPSRTASVSVTGEPLTYSKVGRHSMVLDQLRVASNADASGEARARLQRHTKEMSVELAGTAEYRVDLNRNVGQGGDFVPPLWLMNEWIAYARPGRATANAVSNQALPGGTDSINIPKIATGGATAIQTADNAAVQQTDITDTSVQANVKTIAGQQSVALQLIEQSPINFDQVIFQDLVADYNQKLDLQVINGSNASGQVLGILGTAGIGTVTYSDTTQNAGTMYAAIANAIQLVHVNRFAPPTAIIMHPRRWGGLLAARDSQGRPLFLPSPQEGRNAMGVLDEVASQGVVGNVQGLPVITDANLPTNLGAGTNQDVILVMRASDSILFEGGIRTRALMEVKGQNLEVVLQVYNYVAFTAGRYPSGIVQVSGSGLTAPSFS